MGKHEPQKTTRLSDRVRLAAEYAKLGITITITPDGSMTEQPAYVYHKN